MKEQFTQPGDDQIYEEREAVAIFPDEASLNSAIDELMQAGFRRDDLSLMSDVKSVPGGADKATDAEAAADKDFAGHSDYVSSDSRSEGLAALVAAPVYVAGVGAAAIVATGGAIIPTVAVVAGSGMAAGALGLILARVFGRHHAERVSEQIAKGGLLLWVHLPDNKRDTEVMDILRSNGARDVHLHVVKRSWGASDVPLHDVQPDPFL